DTENAAREAIAGDERFEIIVIDTCPEGWAGKVHAVHTALERSPADGNDLLLFTDADCTFHPSCLRASAALLADRGLHLLSFLNDLRASKWFELVAQPMAGFELVRQFPLMRVNRAGDRQRAFANGQFMLFDPDAYRALGGHKNTRDRLLEDIAFAEGVKQRGMRGGVLLSGGLVRCAMYDTWEQFVRGWKRIYTEAGGRKSDRLLASAQRLLITAGVLPVLAAIGLSASVTRLDDVLGVALLPIASLALLTYLGSLVTVYRGRALLALPTAPIGAALIARSLASAASDLRRGVPTQWGGKEYVREDRAQRADGQERVA
ncbi:MAG: glycosyltransferase, partial [Planctomycetota bacterium]